MCDHEPYYAKGMCKNCYMKAYDAARSQTPERKAYRREYWKTIHQTPEYKEYVKAYQQRYSQTPKRKAYDEARRLTPKYKEYRKAYMKAYQRQSLQYKEYQKAYERTPKRKKYKKEYMRLWTTAPWKGTRTPEDVKQKQRLARRHQVFPRTDSGPEKLLQQALTARNLSFVTHHPVIGQPDIAFPEQKIAIFADGDRFHAHPDLHPDDYLIWPSRKISAKQVREKDTYVTNQLQKDGWTVLRYWESEINANVDGCVDEIEDVWMRKGGI